MKSLPPRVLSSLSAVVVALAFAAVPSRAATFEIVNDDTRGDALRTAILDANATAEPDTIVLPDPGPGEPPVRFDFGALAGTDPVAGDVILPAITSDITIQGPGADRVVLAASGVAGALLVVRTDPTPALEGGLELRARLTLRDLTLERGQGPAAGAVVVRADANPAGERPALIASGVVFSDNDGVVAGAIQNLGAPLDLDGCSFVDNDSDGAGAISTTSGGTIGTTTFTGNEGRVGAVEAPVATTPNGLAEVVPVTLSISGSIFTDNRGDVAGAVRSLADTGIGNTEFIDNRALANDALGGAVQGSHLRVVGGVFDGNVSAARGGALGFFVDVDGGPCSVQFVDLLDNTARGTGGAIHAEGVDLSVGDVAVSRNVAGDGGAGLYALGGSVDVSRSRLTFNRARPQATFTGVDVTVDERGDDVGIGRIQLTGGGSALLFGAATAYTVIESCFVGNDATAVVVQEGATGTLDGNFWGAGDGDTLTLPPGVAAPVESDTPPAICDPAPTPDGDDVELTLTVREDTVGLIGVDYRVVRAGTDITLLTGPSAPLQVDARSGVLELEVQGINDLDDEGDESVVLRLVGCQGNLNACPTFTSNGSPDVGFVITDNGDGVDPGEGEGEGEPCTGEVVDELSVSASELAFDGDSEQPLTVKNVGACPLTLVAPLVRKGTSHGFDVDVVPQARLALEPGDALELVVRYARPAETDAEEADDFEEAEEPSGVLVVESTGGARKEVLLTLAAGCGCRSTAGAPPWIALVALAVVVRGLLRRRSSAR